MRRDLDQSWDLQAVCPELSSSFFLSVTCTRAMLKILSWTSLVIARVWCEQPWGDGCGHLPMPVNHPSAHLSSA